MPSDFPDIDEAISDTLETFETNLEPPTKDEIIRAIKSLKNNKAPGIDNISPEMLKADPKLISGKLNLIKISCFDPLPAVADQNS